MKRILSISILLFLFACEEDKADDNGEDTSQTDPFSCEAAGNTLVISNVIICKFTYYAIIN